MLELLLLFMGQGVSRIGVQNNVTAAVLCGGKSSRMGFDKAFLGYGRHWLLLQNANILRTICASVVLVAEDAQKFARHSEIQDFRILQDRYPNCGPLGGLCTVMEDCSTPYIFLTACDMPYLDPDLILHLYERIQGKDQVILYTHQDRLQPLFAFYHQSCLPVLKQQLQENQLKIRRNFHKFQVREIPLPPQKDAVVFMNLNTPEDVLQWEKKFSEENVYRKHGDSE